MRLSRIVHFRLSAVVLLLQVAAAVGEVYGVQLGVFSDLPTFPLVLRADYFLEPTKLKLWQWLWELVL